jgi:hypothetical protein
MSLTVFGNFRIDSHERLLRMKDSFYSFEDATIDQWVLNIRGPLKNQATEFLKEHLADKLVVTSIETREGWLHDSIFLSTYIKTEYILIWVEDHMCMCGPRNLDLIVKDLSINSVEYMGYSWFGQGLFIDEFQRIPFISANTLNIINYDFEADLQRQKNSIKLIGSKSYIVSLCGIFSYNFFIKILRSKGTFLLRWPKNTPFNFEKSYSDTFILPIKYGVPKFELFSSIDDDNKHSGSSLIARGLYPNRMLRKSMIEIRDKSLNDKNFKIPDFIKRNKIINLIYLIYLRIKYTLE